VNVKSFECLHIQFEFVFFGSDFRRNFTSVFITSPDLWSSKVRGRQKIDIQSMRTPKAIAAEGCSFLVGRLCANQFEKVCRCLQMIPPTWVPTFPHGLSKWSIHIRQTLNNFPLHHFPLHHLIPSSEPQNMTLSPHCTYFWPFHF
jgi:hypothetical protein